MKKSAEPGLSYTCVVLAGGTGSAKSGLGPMISSWGRERGLSMVPGTLNLCADRRVILPDIAESLLDYAHLARPSSRRAMPGFAPRLYPVLLADCQAAWLYRWSDPGELRFFVGDADGCSAERRCEIVAEVRLRDALRLSDGDSVVMRLGNSTM